MSPEMINLLTKLEDLEKVIRDVIVATPGSDTPEGSRTVTLRLSKTLAEHFAYAVMDARVLLEEGEK